MTDIFPESKCLHAWNHAGLACCIASSGIGFINGYVRVPRHHPAFGNNYDRIDVAVHGGLTYSNDRGWFGFDTGHSGDDWSAEALFGAGDTSDSAERATFLRSFGVTNEWNRELLIQEVNSLADQLAGMTELPDPDQWNVTSEEFAQLLADQKELRAIRNQLTAPATHDGPRRTVDAPAVHGGGRVVAE